MDFLNKLGKKANETYQITKEKTTKISEELKLRNKINESKSKIEEIYLKIGECVYNEFEGGEKCDKLKEKCEEITALKEEIVRMENQILSIKNIKKCVSCKTEISRESEFCNKCGAKQPKQEKVEIKEEPTDKAKEAEVIEIKDIEKNENE